jgi:hypothetical protein
MDVQTFPSVSDASDKNLDSVTNFCRTFTQLLLNIMGVQKVPGFFNFHQQNCKLLFQEYFSAKKAAYYKQAARKGFVPMPIKV